MPHALANAELISFRICPFAMRTRICAFEKGAELKTTYIDLANKPDWFLRLSPTGAVPGLKINGRFIFESAVICDLIDELTPGSLYPEDPVQKYHNKSWTEFASSLLFKQFAVVQATDRSGFDESVAPMMDMLKILDRELNAASYWNGNQFSIIDASYAPLFNRFDIFRRECDTDFLAEFPKLATWGQHLAVRPSVIHSCTNEYEREFLSYMQKRQSFILSEA